MQVDVRCGPSLQIILCGTIAAPILQLRFRLRKWCLYGPSSPVLRNASRSHFQVIDFLHHRVTSHFFLPERLPSTSAIAVLLVAGVLTGVFVIHLCRTHGMG